MIFKSKIINLDGFAKTLTLIKGTKKGYSSCDGLILGKGKILTIPALESEKNSEHYHEASIGKIDREALEYLMSKGISEERAKELYIRGFFFSDLPKIDERLKFYIHSIFQ